MTGFGYKTRLLEIKIGCFKKYVFIRRTTESILMFIKKSEWLSGYQWLFENIIDTIKVMAAV